MNGLPPGTQANGAKAPDAGASPAASSLPLPPYAILNQRRDFLSAARARRVSTPSMNVQGRQRPPGEAEGIRVGFTCSKKVGNAVARNRAKRRLREAARAVVPDHGIPGWDYVLIGRAEVTATRPFEDLKADLRNALERLHGGKR